MKVQLHALGLYSRYPLSRRLGGPQSRSGRCGEENILYYRESNPSDPGRNPLLYQLSYPDFYEATDIYFDVLSWHFPRKIENHETSSRRANSMVDIQQETFIKVILVFS
jgi:hypothetical protein